MGCVFYMMDGGFVYCVLGAMGCMISAERKRKWILPIHLAKLMNKKVSARALGLLGVELSYDFNYKNCDLAWMRIFCFVVCFISRISQSISSRFFVCVGLHVITVHHTLRSGDITTLSRPTIMFDIPWSYLALHHQTNRRTTCVITEHTPR